MRQRLPYLANTKLTHSPASWRALLLLVSLLWAGLPTQLLARPLAYPMGAVDPNCKDLIVNGGFEADGPEWKPVGDPAPISDKDVKLSGNQSMLLGNKLGLPNGKGISELRSGLPILLPADATRLILRFRYYPLYGNIPGGDRQRAGVYGTDFNDLKLQVLDVLSNDQNWLSSDPKDLIGYKGTSINLRFWVENDGAGGSTLMYLDDVELEYCRPGGFPTATPTSTTTWTPTPVAPPTYTPTPTATSPTVTPGAPAPGGCQEIVLNGGFEDSSVWHIGEDPVPPRYAGSPSPSHSALRSILLGNPPNASSRDVTSYSSVRQFVTIPANALTAQVRWWHYYQSQEVASLHPDDLADRQEVYLLAPNLQPLELLHCRRGNDAVWQEEAFDLTPYIGQSFYLYFNAYNDHNAQRTWMYLDDVSLKVCYGAGGAAAAPAVYTPVPPPPAEPTLTSTSLPTPTPTVTPVPTITPMAAVVEPVVAAAPADTDLRVAVETEPVIAPTLVLLPTKAATGFFNFTGQPIWSTRLGTVAVLCGIPIAIGLLFWLFLNWRRSNQQ